MKLLLLSSLVASAVSFTTFTKIIPSTTTVLKESLADLKVLATKLNPVVGFYDPLQLSTKKFWGSTQEETIGFLRHAEIKHGRVAMFAFVGYIVSANSVTFPWAMTLDGSPFPTADSAPASWDAIPEAAKIQIMLVIGFLEYWGEANMDKHYMRGGKPGDFPDFDSKKIPGGALNLFDPFGWSKKMTSAKKETRLVAELNNGRLAMIGIMGFVAANAVEGSVPLLGFLPHYSGEVMAPLGAGQGLVHMLGVN